VRAILSAIALLVFVTPAGAQSREVVGHEGFLGEWELVATVTERVADGSKELVGPLSLKHVGMCAQDGPEEKTGELRLQIFGSSATAVLLIDGVECTFNGNLETSYDGIMNCPDRRSVPLRLWIK
jgi:hypothetical protein